MSLENERPGLLVGTPPILVVVMVFVCKQILIIQSSMRSLLNLLSKHQPKSEPTRSVTVQKGLEKPGMGSQRTPVRRIALKRARWPRY